MSTTTTATEALGRAVERATHRVAQLRARQLLRELRSAARDKERARKATQRRCLEFGDVVLRAGFGEWSTTELLGLLLEARDNVGGSRTMRLAYRDKGEQFMANKDASDTSISTLSMEWTTQAADSPTQAPDAQAG